MSKGSQRVHQLLLDYFGTNVKVIQEFHLFDGLRLDFFLPDHNLAVEFDGEGHSEFIEHFHKTAEGYRQAKKRDRLKDEYCAAQGIVLIRFSCEDEISDEVFYRKYQQSLLETNNVACHKMVRSPERDRRELFKAQQKEKLKKARKELYQWMKNQKERMLKNSTD